VRGGQVASQRGAGALVEVQAVPAGGRGERVAVVDENVVTGPVQRLGQREAADAGADDDDPHVRTVGGTRRRHRPSSPRRATEDPPARARAGDRTAVTAVVGPHRRERYGRRARGSSSGTAR
jgi:hypothetical protein